MNNPEILHQTPKSTLRYDPSDAVGFQPSKFQPWKKSGLKKHSSRKGDAYLGAYRLFNRFGEPTSHVAVVTNIHLRKGNMGWVTVNGKAMGAPAFMRAIDERLLRRDA